MTVDPSWDWVAAVWVAFAAGLVWLLARAARPGRGRRRPVERRRPEAPADPDASDRTTPSGPDVDRQRRPVRARRTEADS